MPDVNLWGGCRDRCIHDNGIHEGNKRSFKYSLVYIIFVSHGALSSFQHLSPLPYETYMNFKRVF